MQSEGSSPIVEYQARLENARIKNGQLLITDRKFSLVRALLFFSFCAVCYGYFALGFFSWTWLLPLPLAFVACAHFHSGIITEMEGQRKRVDYYQKCLSRTEGKWQSFGETGERYCETDHPNSGDLDIFGEKSLFQLLCQARTRTGEDTLAAWLKQSASKEEVEQRQEAVEELRNRVNDREAHALLDDKPLPDQTDNNGLLHWAEKPFPAVGELKRAIAFVLPVVTIVSFALYALSIIGPEVFFLALISQLVILRSFGLDVRAIEGEVNQVSQRLKMLVLVLQRLESSSHESEKLKHISTALYSNSLPPSAQVAKLDASIGHLSNCLRNQFFIPVAVLLCLPVHLIYSIARWHEITGPKIRQWITAVGQYEALISLAGFAYENPELPFPVISSSKNCFLAKQIGHPLIAKADCVPNDFHMKEPVSLVMVSGSNMSGKSTLLRSIGVNIVLAMSGSVVRASSLELSPFTPATCMRINDSLQDNTSYFYAVVSRLKLVLELVDNSTDVFFLLDEILAGTNSDDRRRGAQHIISHLLDKKAMGLVTTHDLALTAIPENLPENALNIHFEDQLSDGKMTFDYKIRSGVVKKSNAMALMQMIGLGDGQSNDG